MLFIAGGAEDERSIGDSRSAAERDFETEAKAQPASAAPAPAAVIAKGAGLLADTG